MMKSLARKMQELAAVWLLCVLAGTSCAVFYTKSTDNDYPRIGRRAFFTGTAGSGYPRIGRSSNLDIHEPSPSDVISDYLSKRGIFTQGGHGFPRIGRTGSDVNTGAPAPALSSAAAAMSSSVERASVVESEEEGQYEVPLGLLFFDFDKNGDKMLSREEFVSGMARAREEGTACR